MEGERRRFLGTSRCVGLLDEGREEAVSGGAPAARGCSTEGGRSLFLGTSRCAGLLNGGREKAVSGGAPALRGCSMEGGRMLSLRDLLLHGAAR